MASFAGFALAGAAAAVAGSLSTVEPALDRLVLAAQRMTGRAAGHPPVGQLSQPGARIAAAAVGRAVHADLRAGASGAASGWAAGGPVPQPRKCGLTAGA
jgi:hypothetical protein